MNHKSIVNTNSLQKGRNNMNKENILSKISKMFKEELKNLAWNTSDVEILNILAVNANYEVRCTVAESKNTPVELLAVLAKDEDYDVRTAVAANGNTPANILTMLAKDKDGDVRIAVANNRNTSVDVLVMLGSDKTWWVRSAVRGGHESRQLPAEQFRPARHA